jgi:hypothetical protein
MVVARDCACCQQQSASVPALRSRAAVLSRHVRALAHAGQPPALRHKPANFMHRCRKLTIYSTATDGVHIVGTISAYMANRATGEVLPGLSVAQDVSWGISSMTGQAVFFLSAFENYAKVRKRMLMTTVIDPGVFDASQLSAINYRQNLEAFLRGVRHNGLISDIPDLDCVGGDQTNASLKAAADTMLDNDYGVGEPKSPIANSPVRAPVMVKPLRLMVTLLTAITRQYPLP